MAKAVTLKNTNSEEVYPVTDISLVNGGIYADAPSSPDAIAGEATLKDSNGILYPQVGPGQIKVGNIDQDIRTMELVYEYIQENDSSDANFYVDVPVDFATYEAYHLTVIGVSTSNTNAWKGVTPLNSSKATLSCEEYGVEQYDSAALTGQARTISEMIACGWKSGNLSHIELEVKALNGNDYPWPCFNATGHGAGRNQIILGSIMTSSADVKYFRVYMNAPTGGNKTKIMLYAQKRRS